MKKILGLDIGTTSIGWAIVEATDEKKANEKTNRVAVTDINNDRIGIHKDAVGVRIIPQDSDNISSFNQGKRLIQKKTTTPTAKRRIARGSRRMKSRYKLRRGKLTNVLSFLGMNPDEKYYTNQKGKRGNENDIGKAIYSLRDKAIKEEISLQELGRILLHLNQWRGYSSDRFKKDNDETTDDDFYTSLVISVTEKEKIYKGKKNPKVEKVVFKITFENGDEGIDVVSFGENSYSQFKQGEYATYKREIIEKEGEVKGVILKWQKLKEDDWTYRKWKLNKGIDTYVNIDKTHRTVGSYFYKFFYDSSTPQDQRIERIRNNIVNRDWYEDEFNKVWDFQFEKHKTHFEKVNIEDVVKTAFKDYQAILNEVQKKQGIKEQLKYLLKDKIVYYQRPWQQAKNKGECTFEFVPDVKRQKDGSFIPNINGKKVIDKNGKEIYVKGRTVIPRSHPLYQEYKIWQQINNVRLFLNTEEEKVDLFSEPKVFERLFKKTIKATKKELFNKMNNSKTVTWRTFAGEQFDIKDFLVDDQKNLKKGYFEYTDEETGEVQDAYFMVNFRKKKRSGEYDDIKLKGNATRATLRSILPNKTDEWFNQIHSEKQKISNLQLLWEIIYDITNSKSEDVSNIIEKHFQFDKTTCDNLANVKFDDSGMGKLSAKAIRQLLPLMSDGKDITEKAKKKVQSLLTLNNSEKEKDDDEKLESVKNFIFDKKARLRLSKFSKPEDFRYLNYWEAAAVVYGSHSSKRTIIQPEISRVKQHSMNNPVVEKIVNETISIVNELSQTYGFDEIRIELSRELRASMEERQQMWEAMQEGYEKNEWAKKMLREIKKALIEDNRNVENIDNDTFTKSNVDKMRIIEDVVKFQKREEYKKKEKEFKLDEPSKAEITKYLLWLEQNFKCPYTNQPIPLTDVFARGKAVEIEHIIPKERYPSNAYSNKVITWREVNQRKASNGNRTAYEFIVSKRVENSVKIGTQEYELVPADNWKQHIEEMFPRGAKRNNLLRKEIPEDPIERTLKETQYINKKLKEKLAELVGESKVWVTSGSITDILREKWHLNDVMKELLRERFENFKVPTGKKTFQLKELKEQKDFLAEIKLMLEAKEGFKSFIKKIGKKDFEFNSLEEIEQIANELTDLIIANEREGVKKITPFKYASSEESFEIKSLVFQTQELNNKTGRYENVEKFAGYSKRVDHRHHALDALIIACTMQDHIQYINNLNTINTADQEDDDTQKAKYEALKKEICEGNSSTRFKTPWNKDSFLVDVKNILNEIIISHKNTRLLISPSKHRVDKGINSGKVASIRGELHKETNYAKRNYFDYTNPDRVAIEKLIQSLFKKKQENQNQTMVHLKSFDEIIKETVLKEKYQNILIPLFKEYDRSEIKLNNELVKEYSKKLLQKIESECLLIDSKTNQPLQWLSVYSEKDKSSRPLGLSMDLNKEKEIKDIADPRIKRLAGYRLRYVNGLITEIDKQNIEKKEKDKLKAQAKGLKLYSNAIYEVRIKRGENHFEWLELKDLQQSDFDEIAYAKSATTMLIKEKLSAYDLSELKKTYFEKPIFLSERPIEVKKVRQKSWFQDLYEVTHGRHVYSLDTFMVYLFQEKNNSSNSRKAKFLKFIDAVSIINNEKPQPINYKKLIEREKTNDELQAGTEYDLVFTLAKNDLVFLPEKELSEEQLKEINWGDKNMILPYLHIVKDMNPSQQKIVFQQFCKTDDGISVSKADTKSLFDIDGELSEEVKYGTVDMLQRCIKVFTDKLGKKVVPYWEFPNGCWDNERAIKLGLIRKNLQ